MHTTAKDWLAFVNHLLERGLDRVPDTSQDSEHVLDYVDGHVKRAHHAEKSEDDDPHHCRKPICGWEVQEISPDDALPVTAAANWPLRQEHFPGALHLLVFFVLVARAETLSRPVGVTPQTVVERLATVNRLTRHQRPPSQPSPSHL